MKKAAVRSERVSYSNLYLGRDTVERAQRTKQLGAVARKNVQRLFVYHRISAAAPLCFLVYIHCPHLCTLVGCEGDLAAVEGEYPLCAEAFDAAVDRLQARTDGIGDVLPPHGEAHGGIGRGQLLLQVGEET